MEIQEEEKEHTYGNSLHDMVTELMNSKSKLGTVKLTDRFSITNNKKTARQFSNHGKNGISKMNEIPARTPSFRMSQSNRREPAAPVSMSTSKLCRSVSTPEISYKFNPQSQTSVKPTASRKMNFETSAYHGQLYGSHKENQPLQVSNNTQPERNLAHTHPREFTASSTMHEIMKNSLIKKGSNYCFLAEEDDMPVSPKLTSHLPLSNLNSFNSSGNHFLEKKPTVNKNYNDVRGPTVGRNFKIEIPHDDVDTKVCTTRKPETKVLTKSPNFDFKKPTVRNLTKNSNDLSSSTPNLCPTPNSQSMNVTNNDILYVNGQRFLKLKKLGQGGSSIVYEVVDLQNKHIRALKVVDLQKQDASALEGLKNEIKLLERLQHSDRIIKLFCHEQTCNHLKIVMEVGDIDLAAILNNCKVKKNTSLSDFTIKHYWQEMLLSVQIIHKEGIIHSDLKPANFLLVKATLKLIDFGIATSIQQDKTSILVDSMSGTFNYMSPESLNDINSGPIFQGNGQGKNSIKMGVKADVWSLGCILYYLVYGRLPFQHLAQVLIKLSAIANPNTIIGFPPIHDASLLDVLKGCLKFNPNERPSIEQLLQHPYLANRNKLIQNGNCPAPRVLESRDDSPRPNNPYAMKRL